MIILVYDFKVYEATNTETHSFKLSLGILYELHWWGKNYIRKKTSFLVFWKSISFQKLTDNGVEKRPELVETGFIDHLLKEINYPSSSDGVPSQILLPLKIHLSSTQTTLAGAGEKGESPTKAWPRIVQKLKYSLQAPKVNTSTTEFSSDSFLTFALCNSELPSGSLTIRSCGLNSGGRTFFTKVCLKILAIFSASSSSKFPWHRASIYVCKLPAVHYQIKIAEARGARQKTNPQDDDWNRKQINWQSWNYLIEKLGNEVCHILDSQREETSKLVISMPKPFLQCLQSQVSWMLQRLHIGISICAFYILFDYLHWPKYIISVQDSPKTNIGFEYRLSTDRHTREHYV